MVKDLELVFLLEDLLLYFVKVENLVVVEDEKLVKNFDGYVHFEVVLLDKGQNHIVLDNVCNPSILVSPRVVGTCLNILLYLILNAVVAFDTWFVEG